MMPVNPSPTQATNLQSDYSVMTNHSKSAANAAPAIDMQVLETLQAELAVVAPGLMSELIELYLTNTPHVLATMQQAITENEATALNINAHTLKSNSARLGAITCSRLCLDLEMMGQESHLEGAAEILAELEAEFKRVERALRKIA